MEKPTLKLVREGRYLAEVPVTLIEDETGWAPYLTQQDALKLDEVSRALKNGDVEAAKTLSRVYELLPLTA